MFLPLLISLPLAADSLKNFDIEEAVVVAQPKETRQLRQQPLSVSLFDATSLQQRQVESMKQLSTLAPNFFMPDYGSRLTSAVYIRGIGSRINTPAVGLYVDNVPYVDKSAYDFTFQDVTRVDVLRGPQGTLYGRNTMGGLVRIFTADPLTHYGTDLQAGIGTGWGERAMTRHASLTTYLHPRKGMGVSLSGYYQGRDGYFMNLTNSKKQDNSEAGGGRIRWTWKPTDVVKMDWTASYEHSNEGACPYYLLGQTSSFDKGFETSGGDNRDWGTLNQNRPSKYRRSLFNTGLGVEHQLPRLVLSSITSFQHLNDRLFMDQDFSSSDIFSLCQRQQMSTLSEEISVKSKPSQGSMPRWTWTTGAFAMYQWLSTDCPVTFYGEGVSYLNRQIAANMPQRPAVGVSFSGSEIPFSAHLRTPSLNAAVFHQSTVHLIGGLSLTLGLRLDYDHRELHLLSGTESGAAVPFRFQMAMGPTMHFNTQLEANPSLTGVLKHDDWQVLPKGALNYTLPRGLGNVYFSVAKGYRSGGYNIQSYSDLSQQQLRRSMLLSVKDYSVQTINNLPLPDAMKQGALAGLSSVLDGITPNKPSVNQLYYKPEYTWSYELGIHHNLAERALQLDLSGFYMKTRDQQLARFAESGMGRIMVNAGRSRSYGVELGLRSQLLADRLNLSAGYGLTQAEFTAYDLGASQSGERVDYTGNRVPFVPQHTMNFSVDFRQPIDKTEKADFVKAWSVGMAVNGAGRVMWDEANSFSQPFYATLSARLGAELVHGISIELWARNLTASRYATFAFDSMGNRFAQYGAPRMIGMDLKMKF